MGRSAHRDGRSARGDLVGNDLRARQDQRERSRPEAGCKLPRLQRPARAERARFLFPEDVDDERISGGTALGGVDGADGERLEGETAKAVDGLGGKGDEAAAAKQ